MVVALTIALVALVWGHVPGMNGPFYWKWHWRQLPLVPLAPAMALAAVPFFAGQWIYAARKRIRLALALVTVSTFLLQLAAISAQPPGGMTRAMSLIGSQNSISYFLDARVIHYNHIPADHWMRDYPSLLPKLHRHSKYKPPGPILFFLVFLRFFDSDKPAAIASALALAALGSAAVPMCFALIRVLGRDAAAAFTGASYFALCPSLLLTFPQLDPLYAAVAGFLMTVWGLALLRRSAFCGFVFGLTLALATFTSYIFLGLGFFIAAYALCFLGDRGKPGFATAAVASAAAVAGFFGFYGLLYFAFGFDPIATARVISDIQMRDVIALGRPFPYHIPFDMLDFLLGSGWLSGLLLAFFFISAPRAGASPLTRLAWLGLGQILVIWLAALLPGETARLWLPFMPLLMIPIGIELARWPAAARARLYGCLLLITISICRNMIFVYAGPAIDGPRPFYFPFDSRADRAATDQIDPDPPAQGGVR